MGAFIDFIRHKLIGKESVEIKSKTFEEFLERHADYFEFQLTELALFTSVDLIARLLAKCEFVTVADRREVHGAEYYLWNYRPNIHQTKVEFMTDFVSKLIFRNEALIFETSDGQLLVADSFARQEKAVVDDIFTNVSARNYTFSRTFYSSDVIYLRYCTAPLNALLSSMCGKYCALMQDAAEKYEQSTGHKVVLNIDTSARGDKDFEKNFRELLEKHFKNYFSKKNAVLPLFRGFSYSEPTTDAKGKNVSEVNDLERLRAEAYANVANALHIPPAVIRGDASVLSDAMAAAVGNAVDPIAQMLAQAITAARYGEEDFLSGSYLMIDTTFARHVDAVHDAVNIDKAIACGVLSPERAQRYCNILPCSDAWAKEYYITKNYQNAELTLKGGENE